MAPRAWVCRDPVRREEFLALVRAEPRIRVVDLADRMQLSLSAVRNLVALFEREGRVASAIDKAARRISKSCAPRVVWLVTRKPARIGKPKIPRPAGFVRPLPPLQDWPYAHTGTPVASAGAIQVLAISGRTIVEDRRRG